LGTMEVDHDSVPIPPAIMRRRASAIDMGSGGRP
jgi:hypothetical protein